eukprot:CAMPEP_0117432990 /NCGR_PEP_ID=MMETSP0758-20121206/12415_1 /TAXON_ID=63605 /ORGANISM="Percolomonas cosmopolitus, Strain AE-1 (ATCC 50343)" /LENGTH=448 /DNA_ID=CAMNT_0005223333 /DNA_START=352 /DNA_END=1699 /DNA_ORIENTATION=+
MVSSGSSVASFSDGGFVVVWQTGSDDIYGQVFASNGTKEHSEFRVNIESQGQQSVPAVAVLSDDTFVVVWESENIDGADFGILGQRFRRSTTIDKINSAFLVNNFTLNSQNFPHVSIVWQSENQDYDDYGVFGQVFSHNGNKVGMEFLVNNYTVSSQQDAFVSALPNKGFVITWSSYGVSPQERNIYGRHFGIEELCLLPTLTYDDTFFISKLTTSVTGNVLLNDTADQLSLPLRVTKVNGTTLSLISHVSYRFMMEANGLFEFNLNTAHSSIKSLNEGQQKTFSFSYTLVDVHERSFSANLQIVIEGSNTAPLIFLSSTSFLIYEGTSTKLNVLVHDNDNAISTLSIQFFDKSSHPHHLLTPSSGFTYDLDQRVLQINATLPKTHYKIAAVVTDPHGASSTFTFHLKVLQKPPLDIESNTSSMFSFDSLIQLVHLLSFHFHFPSIPR